MKLSRDIVSHVDPKVVYGTAGQTVSVIKASGEQLLVESDTGDRFWTLAENVVADNVEVAASSVLLTTKPAAGKKTNNKGSKVNQGSMF